MGEEASWMPYVCKALLEQLQASACWPAFLQHLSPWHGHTMRFGTYCSGTDLVVPAHRAFHRAVKTITGIDVQFQHVLSVENNPRKHAFIRHFCPDLPYLFSDIFAFQHSTVHDVLSGKDVTMEQLAAENVHYLVGGFSCKDASPLKNRKNTQHGLESRSPVARQAPRPWAC